MTNGDRRPSAAPVGSWGRAKVLALLVAGAMAGLLLLVGLGLALYYGLDPSPAPGRPASSVPPQGAAGGPRPSGGLARARRDDLAAAPMPPGSATDAQPSVLSTRDPGSISLPRAAGAGPAGVPAGFAHTPPGAAQPLMTSRAHRRDLVGGAGHS